MTSVSLRTIRAPARATTVLLAVTLLGSSTSLQAADEWAALRARMLEEIQQTVVYTQVETTVAELDADVMTALDRVPRHEFVPLGQRRHAYANRPLPVGHGQTISQPYIVALMTHLLAVDASSVVLELGTGSGYQAAVLGELADQVYTMEIVPPLGEAASERLTRLGYDNVLVRVGDGYYGWEEHAPFDGIIVTAAGTHVPPPLVQQLKPGGRLVIPVGPQYSVQQLLLVIKNEDGTVTTRQVLPVRFVPLTGDH